MMKVAQLVVIFYEFLTLNRKKFKSFYQPLPYLIIHFISNYSSQVALPCILVMQFRSYLETKNAQTKNQQHDYGALLCIFSLHVNR